MQKVSAKSSYWKDVFFQASGNSVAQIIGILCMPILTRLYSPEIFAMQAIFIQIVTLLAAFITFRFEYFLQLLDDVNQSYSFILFIICLGFLMTLILTLVIVSLKATDLLGNFNIVISSVFYLAPITAYFICLSIAIQHEAERRGDFKSTSISAVSSKLSYVSSGVILSLFLNSIGLILTTLFGAIGKIIALRRYFLLFFHNIRSVSINTSLINNYIARSKGMVASNTILSFSALLPMFFISKQYGAEFLGQFSLVIATVFIPSGLIGSAVGSVFYQRSARLWNVKAYFELKKLWLETVTKLLIFAIPTYLIIYLISKWAYPFIFGQIWLEAGKIAQLMSLAAFFSFLAGPLDKLSLVLSVAYYLPAIHIVRLLLISLIIFFAYFLKLNEIDFILVFSIGMSLIYLVDIVLCRFYLLNRQAEYE